MPDLTERKTWTKIAFGDVVEHIKDRVQDIFACGLTEYIRGEHFEPGNLRLIGRSTIGDGKHGSAFHMRFRRGDVLYVSRNPQLRKVAVADFNGICANTTYVCRAKEEYLIQELLPFIMQTESFVEYTIRHKRGSTNFYLNWSDISGYEFTLPPLEEQRRIAKLLWAAENYRRRIRDTLDCLRAVKSATEVELIAMPLGLTRDSLYLRDARPTDGWLVCSGQDLLDRDYLFALQDGNHGSQYPKESELGDEGIPYIAASDISDDGDIELSTCRRILPERAARLRIPPARSGDVILTNNATVGRVTRLPEWPTEIVASTSTTYYRCNEDLLDPDYLRWFFETAIYQFQLSTIMRQSTRNQVPITTQKRLLFAIPPIDEQKSLATQLSRFLNARVDLREHGDRVLHLQKLLLEGSIV
jgi:type I restriction enzyme, S subunit